MRISPFLTNKRHGIGKPTASDPQRHKVYAMERNIAGWAIYAHVEQEDLQRIADYVCRRLGLKRVGIQIVHEGKSRVFGWCEDSTIHLNADFHGDNTAVLVHELAHYVTDCLHPFEETHGPVFVHVYGELLDMLNLLPYDCFKMLCAKNDVTIGEYP